MYFQNFMEYAYVRWKNSAGEFCNFDNFAFLGNDVLFALLNVLQLIMQKIIYLMESIFSLL